MTREIRFSKAYARLCLAAAILVVLQTAAHAQSSNSAARPDRGVRPNGSYALSDIENVSMTNGNLNLSIPLASLPPIAGGKLSWSENAIYNAKLWDIKKEEDITDINPGAIRFTRDLIQAADFGGWRVGRAYELVFQKPLRPQRQSCA